MPGIEDVKNGAQLRTEGIEYMFETVWSMNDMMIYKNMQADLETSGTVHGTEKDGVVKLNIDNAPILIIFGEQGSGANKDTIVVISTMKN